MKNLLFVLFAVVGITLLGVIGIISQPQSGEVSFNETFVSCDALNPCESGDCYKFHDLAEPVCYEGDPCERCPSKICTIAESYPMQIFCQ